MLIKRSLEYGVWIYDTFYIGTVMNNICPSNIILTLLLPAQYYQNCQATFCHCEHLWVKQSFEGEIISETNSPLQIFFSCMLKSQNTQILFTYFTVYVMQLEGYSSESSLEVRIL